MSAVLMLPCGADYVETLVTPIILQEAEAQFDISRADLCGCARSEKHVLPRHAVILAMKGFGVSNAAAAAVVGRDETAVIYAMNKALGRTPRNVRLRRAAGKLRERVFQRMKSS